jgi:hypothetical protein
MQRDDLTAEERLKILRAGDKLRTWSSLDDERLCVLCERILSGWQIEILRDQRGRYLLKCPTSGCDSFAAHWLYLSNAADRLGDCQNRADLVVDTGAAADAKFHRSEGADHGQTQKLLLSALRLWELRNGYRR